MREVVRCDFRLYCRIGIYFFLIKVFGRPTCMLPKGLPPPIEPGIKPPKLPVMPSVISESWDIYYYVKL